MRKFVVIEKLPSGNYSVRHWENGGFKREWFSDYSLAKTRAANLEVALLAKRQGQSHSLVKPLDLLKEYINDPEANEGKGFSEQTKTLKMSLGNLMSSLEFVSGLTTSKIKDYLNSFDNLTTRSIRYQHLHAFCEWCIKKGYLRDNPFYFVNANGVKQKLSKPKSNERDVKLSLPEIQTLITEASLALRLRLMHVALTGKRKSEILGTEWKHLDLENKTWFIPKSNSKSRFDSTVPIPENLVEEFKKYKAATGSLIGKVHPQNGFNRALNALASRLGIITKVTPHVFRHSFASHWRGSPQVLMGLMGWKSMAMIKKYTHLNAEDLRNEADNFGLGNLIQR